MIKISEPSTQTEFKQDIKRWLVFTGFYIALFFLLIFRWGPAQLALAYLTRPCPETVSKNESAPACQEPDWMRLIGSSW